MFSFNSNDLLQKMCATTSLIPPSFSTNSSGESTMLSLRWLQFSLLPLFFTLKSKANYQKLPIYSKCNEILGNFTHGGDYENNRNTVFELIYSDRKIDYGFYHFSHGEVYAIALCRSDINQEDCHACLKTCAQLLKDRCPTEKAAIGYFNFCILRYSSDPMFGVMNTETSYVYFIVAKTVVDDAFNRTLNGLLDQLKSTAAEGDSNKKFAEKSVKVIDESSDSNSNETIRGLAQCTPDLTDQDCKCLDVAYGQISIRCREMKGSLYFGESCLVRYDISPLLESPAPQPPKRKKTIVIVLAIVVAGILFVGSICFYLGRRKATKFEDKTTVDDAFNQTLSNLLDELKSAAAEGDSRQKFAEKSVKVIDETSSSSSSSSSNDTIYGLVQCTPDLSKTECTDCLDSAFGQISFWCKERKGCLYLGPICSVKYDMAPFFQSIVNSTEPPSPAPQPSQALPPAISPKTAPANSTNTSTTSKGKRRRLRTAIAVVVAVVVTGILAVGICIYLGRKKPRPEYTAEIEGQEKNEDEDEVEVEVEACNDLKVGELMQFDFASIRLATNNFSDANKLGQGGFGSVYKGTLSDGHDIAIKRLANNSEQGETEFKNEVLLTGKLQHRNLVKLLGFCLQRKERLLIYEFVSNKSLDYIIFDPMKRAILNWERRFKIIKDIARGLLYLHEDSRLQIVHRDLKTSNILLDEEMNPKITDFGLARLFDANQTHGMTTTVVGTYGYMAPEYIRHGQFSVKSDVFSFGVIILEIVCGQRNTEIHDGESIEDLLGIAWKNWKARTSSDIVDPILHQGFSKNEKMRCIHVGLLCVQEDIAARPNMSSVLLMLNSTTFPLPEPSEPPFLMQPKRAS